MPNTEKPTTQTEAKKQGIVNTPKKEIIHTPVVKEEKKETKKAELPKPITKIDAKPKVKKTEAFVKTLNIPISTKQSMAICKFIRGKTIEKARKDLEEVIKIKKAVPMKGEIPHRKGKIMSGRFPQKAAKNFIVLLKSLAGNCQDIDSPTIVEAIANIGERPYGKFGRVRKKRTHIFIKAMEKSKINKGKKNGRKKNR